MVIVQIGSQRVGLVVDTLIGQEEVVIKPLDKLLQGTPGMSGATITSDGHIALILMCRICSSSMQLLLASD